MSSSGVDSVNVGSAETLTIADKQVASGIYKRPCASPVRFAEMGLEGDQQVDRESHGGPDKALCVYSADHFPAWSERLGAELGPGSFGENLTIAGLTEADVAIGDIYRVGGSLAQVTQPRQPCVKLATRHRQPKLVRWVVESGKTGFYLRCLQPGEIQAGDAFELVERPQHAVGIDEANRVMHHDRDDRDALKRLLACAALSAAWRDHLTKRLTPGLAERSMGEAH